MVMAPVESASGVSANVAASRAANVLSRSAANNRSAIAATIGMPSQIA